MTERIVAPAAAAVAVVAAVMATATISLMLTVPTGEMTVPVDSDLLPVFRTVLAFIWETVWTALERL